MSEAEPKIVVAVLTYLRPAQLASLLAAVAKQVSGIAQEARLVVVDNDPAASAAQGVEAIARTTSCRLSYVHEPRPGISAARNAALAAAADSDALVFIDDDEVPGKRWLEALVNCWLSYRSAAVTGPVITTIPPGADPWVAATGAFQRPSRETGVLRPGAATNNLLLDLAFLREHALTFDESLGLIGGEDTMLTHCIVALGGEIRWCDEAEVFEDLAVNRATRRWVLMRAYRSGASWARAERKASLIAETNSRGLATLIARGLVRATSGIARYVGGSVSRNPSMAARGMHQAASHLGLLSGLMGLQPHEYQRPSRTSARR